jgi:hypothetical protein
LATFNRPIFQLLFAPNIFLVTLLFVFSYSSSHPVKPRKTASEIIVLFALHFVFETWMSNSTLLYWLQPKSLNVQPKAELVPVKVTKAYSGNRVTTQRILNLAIT